MENKIHEIIVIDNKEFKQSNETLDKFNQIKKLYEEAVINNRNIEFEKKFVNENKLGEHLR